MSSFVLASPDVLASASSDWVGDWVGDWGGQCGGGAIDDGDSGRG